MDRRFIRAFTDPGEVALEGYRLYPFCLKYRLRLYAIDSPYTGDHRIGQLDLLAAIKTCAELPIDDVTVKDKATLMSWKQDERRFQKACLDFKTYMLEETWPKFWEKEGKAGGSNSPWPLAVVCNLISNGIPEKRAWEMPEAQAVWLSCNFAQIKGAEVNILTTDEEDAMAEFSFTDAQGKEDHGPIPRV